MSLAHRLGSVLSVLLLNVVISLTAIIAKYIRKQPDFAAALSALEHAPEAHSLTLQSFLILPMQHITRLPLLVDAILHQLDAQPDIQSSQDYAAVSRCLETLHTVCLLFVVFFSSSCSV